MGTQNLYKRFLGKKWLSLPLVILLILIGLSGGTTALSQEADGGGIARMVVTRRGIKWVPLVKHDGIVLTVAGPEGAIYRQEFAPGEMLVFGLVDSEGQSYPDGSYTYELVAKPVLDAEERAALEEARESGASIEMPQQVQSGHFAISDGVFVTVAALESGDAVASPDDEVIYDDLIVDGSLCVGNDCYSGLAFGFDTIVLMENNLRIFFDDTSNTSSFPNNDWRIVINDTTDGGASYFALQDVSGGLTPFTVEAGAKSNSLYVDDDGQVGIGTSGPVFELHIKEGDTPTVRLHQSTSYGWPEQIWDVGGNETSFFIRDGTHAARLPFRIEPEAPTSSLAIKSDGKIGIGTWSPAFPIEVERTGSNAQVLFDRTDGAEAIFGALIDKARFGSRTNHPVNIIVNNTGVATFETGGDLTLAEGGEMNAAAFNIISDVNAKENFDAVDGKEVLARLEGVEITVWNFKGDDVRHIGPMAQDFYAAYGLGADDKRISTTDADGVALAAIKELDAQNKALYAKNEVLEADNAALRSDVNDLEADNAALRSSLNDLEARMAALEAKASDGAASAVQPLSSNGLLIAGLLLAGAVLGLGLSACLIRMARHDSSLNLLKV